MKSRYGILIILALLHAYIGWRLCSGLQLETTAILLVGLGLMTSWALMPLSIFVRGIPRQWADLIAWAGYLIMGLFSSLLILTLARDLVLGGLALFSVLTPWLSYGSALAVAGLALLVTAIGLINARRLAQVIHVDIPLKALPPELEGFTIAQLSDIHVGPTIKQSYLQAIVERVNALDPDLIAITGDVVDGSVEHLSTHTEPLANLQARHGVYLVTGNHEYYSGANAWIEEFRRLGLSVLLNQHVTLEHQGATLLVAGVTDFSAGHFDQSQRSAPQRALAGAPDHAFPRVLLAHQPRSAQAAAEAGFHLQLSGHTHGGQFWPWNLFVTMQQPYVAGLDRLRDLWIYTSRGTGYWGPPKRFGAPSEITLIRLVRELL
ncbi:ser/threonine protein phosphatase [Marinobacterium zhoushanense]|uniref:Ser/threonine protein phosphatase n=1 Tax=Marinobacterium zhoushanense TaxID=1679163 RepID=A0ABQ1L023_9GAMM|nr:metallophosphoesterase [Marinobacterium zhoushanense]GGC11035.1 ser/threonine protein phosphatase [Marinobacterium zhoushanense]